MNYINDININNCYQPSGLINIMHIDSMISKCRIASK